MTSEQIDAWLKKGEAAVYYHTDEVVVRVGPVRTVAPSLSEAVRMHIQKRKDELDDLSKLLEGVE